MSDSRRFIAAYAIGSGSPILALSGLELIRELLNQDNLWFDMGVDVSLFFALMAVPYYQHFYQENPKTIEEAINPPRTLFALTPLSALFFYALQGSTINSLVGDPEGADFQAAIAELGVFAVVAGAMLYQIFEPLHKKIMIHSELENLKLNIKSAEKISLLHTFLETALSFVIAALIIGIFSFAINFPMTDSWNFDTIETLEIECGVGAAVALSGVILYHWRATDQPPSKGALNIPTCAGLKI